MEKKTCFGDLQKVFPMGDEGLREVPAECNRCPDRVRCMRQALKTREGLELRSEKLDRAASSGMMGRLRRWSQKKELSRLMKEREKSDGH